MTTSFFITRIVMYISFYCHVIPIFLSIKLRLESREGWSIEELNKLNMNMVTETSLISLFCFLLSFITVC